MELEIKMGNISPKPYWEELIDNLLILEGVIDQRLTVVNEIYDTAVDGSIRYQDFKHETLIQSCRAEAKRLAGIRKDVKTRLQAAYEHV